MEEDKVEELEEIDGIKFAAALSRHLQNQLCMWSMLSILSP